MSTAPEPRRTGLMVYPRSAWRRAFFRAPLVLWRLGLGRLLQGRLLVLTTRGRRSGDPRRTMLEYSQHGGRVYLASGWGLDPDWCKNILRSSQVTAQCAAGTIRALAVRVTADDEVLALYHEMRGKSPVWQQYLTALGIEDTPEDFLAKKDRAVTWRLDPTEEPTPPPLRADLAWIWAVALALAVAVWIFVR